MTSKPAPIVDATAGTVGAVVANILVFPLDVVKTRMQVHNKLLSKPVAARRSQKDIVTAEVNKKSTQMLTPLNSKMTSSFDEESDASNHEYRSMVDALLKIYNREGFAGLYSGIGSGLVGVIVSSFSYFYIYSYIRNAYSRRIGSVQKTVEISTAMELGLGALAGALSQLFVLPIANVTTR